MKIDKALNKILTLMNVNHDKYLWIYHGGYGVGNVVYVDIKFVPYHPQTRILSGPSYYGDFSIIVDDHIYKQFGKDCELVYSDSTVIGLKIPQEDKDKYNIYIYFRQPSKRSFLQNLKLKFPNKLNIELSKKLMSLE